MRVPLPGRDYFPARVLMRGARPAKQDAVPGGFPAPGSFSLAWRPSPWPAMPPVPAAAARPAA